MAHDITYLTGGHHHYSFRCRCGATCEPKRTRQMVEDEVRKHHDLIARITKPRTTTLEVEYRWAKQMADDVNVSQADRVLWKQQATELGKRLGYEAPPSAEQPLFTL